MFSFLSSTFPKSYTDLTSLRGGWWSEPSHTVFEDVKRSVAVRAGRKNASTEVLKGIATSSDGNV